MNVKKRCCTPGRLFALLQNSSSHLLCPPTRRAPSRRCRDARVYGNSSTTAIYDMSTPLPRVCFAKQSVSDNTRTPSALEPPSRPPAPSPNYPVRTTTSNTHMASRYTLPGGTAGPRVNSRRPRRQGRRRERGGVGEAARRCRSERKAAKAPGTFLRRRIERLPTPPCCGVR